jgi:protein-S-isoprenylcysteine O-methyltransferase Ste14
MDIVADLQSAFLVLIAGFVIFRVIVRRDYRRRGRLTLLDSALEWLAILFWVYWTSVRLPAHWPAVRVTPIVAAVGWVLFVGGLLAMFASFFRLGVGRSHGLKVDGLRQSGPYRLTRNPQCVAFGVAMIGHTMLWPSWPAVGSLVLLAPLLHMMVLTEEEHLREVFGEEYERYCARVPRYVGISRGVQPSHAA